MVQIIGVSHKKTSLRSTKFAIDQAAKNGARSIGIELSPFTILKPRPSKNIPRREIAGFRESDFFGELAAYAESKGMKVVPLGSFFLRDYGIRVNFRKIKPRISPTISIKDYDGIVEFSVLKDTEIMLSQIKTKKPDSVLVGAVHGVIIAEKLKVPVESVNFVGISQKKAVEVTAKLLGNTATLHIERALSRPKTARRSLRRQRPFFRFAELFLKKAGIIFPNQPKRRR